MDIQAQAGVPFEIRVERLGSAGYQWHVDALPAGVELVDSRTEPPAPGSPPGSTGLQVFRFTASARGHYDVSLMSKRAWEAAAASHRRFAVEVR